MAKALLIVDVQNDFTEGGALGVTGGAAVAAGISDLLRRHGESYAIVVASRDWHNSDDDNGGHFATDAEPDFVATWPRHCVAGSSGAEYHPDLATDQINYHIRKGQGAPAYSAFEGTTENGTTLSELIRAGGITTIDIVGIATDYCVRASALDACDHGQHVRIFTDLVAGVAPESTETSLAELGHAGVVITDSTVVNAD